MPGVAVFGITGRMGQTLVRALRETAGVTAPDHGARAAAGDPVAGVIEPSARAMRVVPLPLRLSGAIASAGSRRLGQDAATEGAPTGVLITAEAATGLAGATVAIDFSVGACVAANARACALAGVPLLVGTTGFDAAARSALETASAVIPVVIAPNTSVGVTVVARLVELATRALGVGYDVEISESHHRLKRDAPSGTALALGEVVAGARASRLPDVAVYDRHGAAAPRQAGDIGFAVTRAGDIVGEHTVMFAAAGERIEITHRATDRMTFARGALRVAHWLVGRPPGLYGMPEALGLEQP